MDITIDIAGRSLTGFKSYSIESDLYQAADAWSIELGDPGFELSPDSLAIIKVGKEIVLTGVLDRVEVGGDKSGNTVKLAGRDLAGMLIDSYVSEFLTLENMTLKEIALRLIKGISYINAKQITFQKGLSGLAAKKTDDQAALYSDSRKKTQIEPGQSVFDVLKDIATKHGAMFWMEPNGTLVFGRPKTAGAAPFRLTRRKDGLGNNVISGTRIRDNSMRWSSITITGQRQGDESLAADQINQTITLLDSGMTIKKPYVQICNDGDDPKRLARMLLDRQRANALKLEYTVAGHAQDNKLWVCNELCSVEDEVTRVCDFFLIYKRTFTLDKQNGRRTSLTLGLPGLVA